MGKILSPLKTAFLRNLGFGILSKFSQMLAGFFIIGFVIKSVGIEQWGLLTVSVSLISLLSVLQSSISGAAGKKMTDFLGKGDRDEYQRYFFATVQLTIAVCILIFFFLSCYFIFFIDSLIDSDVEALKIVFGVTSLNVLIQILSLPALAVLQSFNRIDYQSKATIFAFLLRFILVFTVFIFIRNIQTYAWILLVEVLMSSVMLYFFAFKQARLRIDMSLTKIDYQYLMGIVKFNFLNLFNNLNYLIFLQVPAIIITKFFGLTMAGYYGVGLQVNGLLRGFVSVFSASLMPIFNILRVRGDRVRLSTTFLLSMKLFSLFSFTTLFFFILFSPEFLSFWLGKKDAALTEFITGFSVFINVGVFFIPSALILVTLEKLKTTSILGFFFALIGSFMVYWASNFEHSVLVLNFVMGLTFFIYNFQRFIQSVTCLELRTKDVMPLLLYLFFPIAFLLIYRVLDLDLELGTRISLFVLFNSFSILSIKKTEWIEYKQLIFR